MSKQFHINLNETELNQFNKARITMINRDKKVYRQREFILKLVKEFIENNKQENAPTGIIVS